MNTISRLVVIGSCVLAIGEAPTGHAAAPARSGIRLQPDSRRPSAGQPVAAEVTKAQPVAEVAARLGRLLPELMEQAAIPGVQLAIVRDGATAWHGAFGLANASTYAPVTDASVFEAASLSKPVFAYAVLKLVDEGRLVLDVPITTYLPGPYDVETMNVSTRSRHATC